MKIFIIYLLFIPFYEGQFVDGIRKVVNSPEEAFFECQQADTYQAMPNGSKYAKLFKINLRYMTFQEVEIPNEIRLTLADESIAAVANHPFRESGKVWMEIESGEGGAFDEAGLFEVIKKFYDDNF